ncbi:MAG: TetR family transcriptional regulator [Bryobacterales bacterium]|nr:TetR family transcriptional regulator [Bryobacterales bacterium]
MKEKTIVKTTSERALDAAEALFAKQGIRATSLREITELGGINIAAINYHFRSKEALVRAVYERSFHALNDERLRLLDEAERAASGEPLTIEAILYAFFEPMVRAWKENPNFILIVGRLQHEPDPELSAFIQNLYADLIRRFLAAAARALPGYPEADLFFWVHFLFGGVVYTLLASQDIPHYHQGRNLLETPDDFLKRLIRFGAAALRDQQGTGVRPRQLR